MNKITFSKQRFKQIVTKRAKILYIISCIFQIHIRMPDYEWEAMKKAMEESENIC